MTEPSGSSRGCQPHQHPVSVGDDLGQQVQLVDGTPSQLSSTSAMSKAAWRRTVKGSPDLDLVAVHVAEQAEYLLAFPLEAGLVEAPVLDSQLESWSLL